MRTPTLRQRLFAMAMRLEVGDASGEGAARALGRDLSPVGRRPSTAFKGSLSALRSMRTIRFIGAPFCEGQNLDGADLGPTALREAGLQPLAEMLGWSWEDAGDLDFAAEFERLGFEVSAPHHHPVELYREWVGDSGMRDTPSMRLQPSCEGSLFTD